MEHVTRDMIDALNQSAECRDAPPNLFDATELHQAAQGLSYCATCIVTVLCRAVIRPGRTYYDGIAGGSVYRNGRVVASLTRDSQTRQLVSTMKPRSHT